MSRPSFSAIKDVGLNQRLASMPQTVNRMGGNFAGCVETVDIPALLSSARYFRHPNRFRR
jgi:hypothetical protein